MDKILLCSLLISLLVQISKSDAEAVCNHQCTTSKTCNLKQFKNRCFYLFKDSLRTWSANREICERQGLSMVKVTKDMLNTGFNASDLFQHLVGQKSAWLGGRAEKFSEWKFLNDTVLRTSDLSVTWAFNGGGRNAECGILKRTGVLTLGSNFCFNKNYFVCRLESCSENVCWEFVKENKTWFEARSHCIDLGGDLFYLKDGENWQSSASGFNRSVYQFLTRQTLEVHIGIRHRLWKWNDGDEILFTNWNTDESNNFVEECVMLNGETGRWTDDECNDKKLALCQGGIGRSTTRITLAAIPSTTIPSTTIPRTATPPILQSNNTRSSAQTDSTTSTTVSVSSSATPRRNIEGGMVTPTSEVFKNTAIHRNKDQVISSVKNDSMAKDPNFLPIILGTLLSVVFVITLALAIFITHRKCKKKSSEQDTEFIENNYYETSPEPVSETPVAPASTQPYEISHVPLMEYSSSTAAEIDVNGGSAQSSPKPVTKPKLIIGPKTGDVYSSVDKLNKLTKPMNRVQHENTD